MTSSDTKTPIFRRGSSMYESVSQLLPAGHEKPLKQALYTTAALVLVITIFGVAACACFVLQVFIKPLLWSVLCGSFLFPFKYALQKVIDSWLQKTLQSEIPLVACACILPVTLFFNFSDWLGDLLASKWKILTGFVTGFLSMYLLHYSGLWSWIFSGSIYLIQWSFTWFYYIAGFMKGYNGLILLFIITYFLTAIYLNLKIFRIASVAMWGFLLMYILGVTGALQIPLVVILIFLLLLGLLQREENSNTGRNANSVSDISIAGHRTSDLYFNALFVLFSLVVVWLHLWILLLMLIPLSFWCCKNVILHEKTWEIVDIITLKLFNKHGYTLLLEAIEFWKKHKVIVFPQPLPTILKVLVKGDRKMHISIMSSLPTVTSILIILLLFTNAIFALVFMVVKIQQESFLLVQVTSNLINETVAQHPEYKSWLPDNETMHKSMDSIVDVVYLQGREWIKQKVQANIGSNANVTKVENQVLKMWDQIYHSALTKKNRTTSPLLRRNSMKSISGSRLVHGFVDLLNMNEVMSWLQENVSALMSLGETLLAILRSNFALIMSVFSALINAFLSGSTLVLNFLVSLVIFFTSLFYLLSSSTDSYKPIELIGSALRPLTSNTSVEDAIQDAVNGVFVASIKMFGFYGVYTWINHCLFGSNLVYIPSILAAIFGVIPLLTTYWVSIPSALEIWLIQGSLLRAVGLVVCQFLPTLFVDAAIYKEIAKTGGGAHPYVTGLAVAGGLYTFGLEGAVGGPLILCFLLVAVNLYTQATRPESYAQRIKKRIM